MIALPHHLASQFAGSRWTLDRSASTVEFDVRQFWGRSTVHGRFTSFEGELYFSSEGVGRALLSIDAATVETGNVRRDRHLRGTDYFDCERHPLVRFAAAVAPTDDASLRLSGELYAGGASLALDVIAAVDRDRNTTVALSGSADFDARELDMTWSPFGSLRTPVALSVHARLQRTS